MPKIKAERLEEIGRALFAAAGTPAEEAALVMRHIGRLSRYTQRAAQAGMIGLITADSGRSPKAVAPFGGREARLGTNPISMAIPSDLDGPLYLDMATSAVAAGKIQLAAARGEQIPTGWIVDGEGRQT